MTNIYKIMNLLTNECYIGQTKQTINRRIRKFNAHFGCRKLEKAYEEYGRDNFSVELLEQCNDESADEREDYYISLFNSIECGYNIYGGGTKTHKSNYESNKLISNARKGQHNSPKTEFKKGMKAPKTAIKKGEHRGKTTEFTSERTSGKNNPRAYGVYQINLKGEIISYFDTAKEASEKTGINRGSICSARSGRIKSAGGYIWKSNGAKETE